MADQQKAEKQGRTKQFSLQPHYTYLKMMEIYVGWSCVYCIFTVIQQ